MVKAFGLPLEWYLVDSRLTCKYWTRVKVTTDDNHTSLLQRWIYCGGRKSFSTNVSTYITIKVDIAFSDRSCRYTKSYFDQCRGAVVRVFVAVTT